MRKSRIKRRRKEKTHIILKNIIMAVIVIIISLISYYNTFYSKGKSLWIIQLDRNKSSGYIRIYKENIKNYGEKLINVMNYNLKH
ncbi:hypothetical protein [Haloimpatiens lingqiaonensis]|uniref:hypothetical protein n=1 Tax=Haloimpatiens lingqiaonensis TaxID=1380675 RepID=UPI0010FD9AE9|nr:hypothetical protein [Haloimpatiens lingqiaonensis]